jgi:hypothetical protein
MGVALLSVSADVLRSFHEPLNLGPDSSVNLVRHDGWIIMRDPPARSAECIGTSPFWRRHDERGRRWPRRGSTALRIVGYRNLTDLGIVVNDMSRDRSFVPCGRRSGSSAHCSLPFALVLFLGSLWTRGCCGAVLAQRTLAAAVAHNRPVPRDPPREE